MAWMEWPSIAHISTLAPLPDGYYYEKPPAADVRSLIAGIRRLHPDIAVGRPSGRHRITG